MVLGPHDQRLDVARVALVPASAITAVSGAASTKARSAASPCVSGNSMSSTTHAAVGAARQRFVQPADSADRFCGRDVIGEVADQLVGRGVVVFDDEDRDRG